MQCLIKGFGYLKFNEYKKLVVELFPNATKEEQTKVIKFARDLNENLKLHEAKRHPLILIVDEVSIISQKGAFLMYISYRNLIFCLGN